MRGPCCDGAASEIASDAPSLVPQSHCHWKSEKRKHFLLHMLQCTFQHFLIISWVQLYSRGNVQTSDFTSS